MSRLKKSTTYQIDQNAFQSLRTNEPISVVYNLNRKYDIRRAIETLLQNNELKDSSSVFIVVPTDDEDDEDLSDGLNSTIAIQLSDNCTDTLKNCKSDSDMRFRRQVSKQCSHESKVFEVVLNATDHFTNRCTNKLCQITTPYDVSNKLCQVTTPCQFTNKLCQVTTPDGDRTPYPYYYNQGYNQGYSQDTEYYYPQHSIHKQYISKLCQAKIPAEIIYEQRFAADTDTTLDRPCCCPLEVTEELLLDKPCCCLDAYFTESTSNRIISNSAHLVSPVLVKTDFSGEDFNSSKQSSFLQPSNIPFSSISASLITPQIEELDRDPLHEINQRFAYNTPVPELEGNQDVILQSCQCTPEKLRRLLEQVLAEKAKNKMTVCCGSPMEAPKVVKRTRFLEIKCSGCFKPNRQIEGNTCLVNPSNDCDCEKLLMTTGQHLQNIGTSALYCLDDPTNRDTLVTEKSNGQLKSIISKKCYPKLKARGTYTEAGQPRKHNTMVATDPNQKHVATYVAPRKKKLNYRPSNPINQDEDKLVTNYENYIQSNLPRSSSEIRFPLHNISPQTSTVNVATNIVGRQNSNEHRSARPIPDYDNDTIDSKTVSSDYDATSDLIRALSDFKCLKKSIPHSSKSKPIVTFEEFLEFCSNINRKSGCNILSAAIQKTLKNYSDKQKPKPSNLPLTDETEVSKSDVKIKEEPFLGLKLCMSGKARVLK